MLDLRTTRRERLATQGPRVDASLVGAALVKGGTGKVGAVDEVGGAGGAGGAGGTGADGGAGTLLPTGAGEALGAGAVGGAVGPGAVGTISKAAASAAEALQLLLGSALPEVNLPARLHGAISDFSRSHFKRDENVDIPCVAGDCVVAVTDQLVRLNRVRFGSLTPDDVRRLTTGYTFAQLNDSGIDSGIDSVDDRCLRAVQEVFGVRITLVSSGSGTTSERVLSGAVFGTARIYIGYDFHNSWYLSLIPYKEVHEVHADGSKSGLEIDLDLLPDVKLGPGIQEYWFRGRLLDVALNNSHEGRLKPTGWMDDRIADIFIDRITSFALAVKLPNAPHVPFPYWLPVYLGNGCTQAVLANLLLNSKTKVVLLVHDANHWLVVLLFSTSESCFHDKNCQLLVLDSIKSNERLARIGQLVRMLLRDYWRTLHPDGAVPQHLALLQPKHLNVPQQPNAYDCGYYSLRFVEIIVFTLDGLGGLDLRLSFGAGDIAKLRGDLLALFNDIKNGKNSCDAVAQRWRDVSPVVPQVRQDQPLVMKLTPLINIGATCYLNAAVAVLASSPVSCFLLDVPVNCDWRSGLCRILSSVFQAFQSGVAVEKTRVEDLFAELSHVECSEFFETAKSTHHDVLTCLVVLLAAISDVGVEVPEKSFGIDVECLTICASGLRGDPAFELQFAIDVRPRVWCSLDRLLEELFSGPGSQISGDSTCGACGHPWAHGCRRQHRISTVHGTCFTIFISRAQQDTIAGDFRSVKYFAPVDINETLTVEGIQFALAVVVVHIGHSPVRGHYIYYRRVGSRWFKVNDDVVSPVISLENVIFDYYVLCNVALCVYDRTVVAKSAVYGFSVRPHHIATLARCLVAGSGICSTAKDAASFLAQYDIAAERDDFPDLFCRDADNRAFQTRCARALLDLAVAFEEDGTARTHSKCVLALLETCAPKSFDVGILRALCASAPALHELPSHPPSSPLPSSPPPSSPLHSVPSSPDAAAFLSSSLLASEEVEYASCSVDEGSDVEHEHDIEEIGFRQRVPIRNLERLLQASVTKSSSKKSRSLNASVKRIAAAFDHAVKLQAAYKKLRVEEVAVKVVKQSKVLSCVEFATEDFRLAKIGQAVVELAALACADNTKDDIKTLVKDISAQTLLIGLCRSSLKYDDMAAFELKCARSTFTNAKAALAQLKDPFLREAAMARKQLLDGIERAPGRPRGAFSYSRTNPVPLLASRPHAKAAAMLQAIVALAVVAPAHFVAKVSKSTCPLDVAVRVALGVDVLVQMRLQVEAAEAYHYYISVTAKHLQYAEAHFYNLLSATVLIVKNDMKAGVCNKCSLLDETLDWVGAQARLLLSRDGEDLTTFLRLLQEVRLHVFRGQLQRSSIRSSGCGSHNPAWALDEQLPDGVSCNETCLACDMVVALAKKLLSSCSDTDLNLLIRERFQLIAFLFGHNVLKSDAERRVRSCHEKVDVCEDGSLAVLYLDMMMKILPMVPHEAKEKWYGKVGWISQVAAIYWRLPTAKKGMFFYVVLENWQVQKSNAGVIMALFDATLKEIARIAPQIAEISLVCDDGPNYSSNECVLNFPYFARRSNVTVTEMVLMEGGSGKGPHDAIGGAIQASVRRQVSLGRQATTTPERMQCLTGPDGRMRVNNTIVALVTLNCKEYDEQKNEEKDSSQKRKAKKGSSQEQAKSKKAGGKKSKPNAVTVAITGINNRFHHVYDQEKNAFLSRRTALSVAEPTITKLEGWRALTTSGSADEVHRVGIQSVEDLTMPSLPQLTAKANASSAIRIVFGNEHVHAFVASLTCPFPFCLQQVLEPTYDKLEAHFGDHFGFGPMTCCECKTEFKHKKQSFALHMLVKHLQLAWQCADCDEYCETASKAQLHCQLRRFAAPDDIGFGLGFVCQTCLKPFHTESGFQKHKPKCEKRAAAELVIDETVKSLIRGCLATMPGMALFGATLRDGVPIDKSKLEDVTKRWCGLDVDMTLFQRGFAQPSVWKTLNPSHRKPWVEVVLLVVLWHLGDVKADFFRKGCSATAAEMLDELGCKGHSAKKIAPFFNSITKEQSKDEARAAFSKVKTEATVWVRDGLVGGDRNIACGVPRELFNSDLFFEKHRELFLPYFKSDLSVAAFVALFGMAYCTLHKLAELDENEEEQEAVIGFTCGAALGALDRLYERGSSGVKLARVELFFGLFRSIVAPEKLLKPTEEEVRCLQRWVSAVNDVDEWRGVLVPTELSFLNGTERAALKKELESVIYPVYCTCKTVLGQVENRELQLIACEAVGGCTGRRWFHVECGHKPAADTGAFVCADCRAARP